MPLKGYVARTLAQVQGTFLYRIIAHARKPVYIIREASGTDLVRGISALFGSEKERVPCSDQSVVNCLIQCGNSIAGFGQLVYRSEKSGFFAGFWIHGI